MKELSVLELPLVGQTLVEANAGTGKTWSVTGIYLRLLLECDLEVEQILVMTFTRAATAELRNRLRARIALMLARLEGVAEVKEQDPLIEELLLRLPDQQLAANKLARSLRAFDLAAIFTIHGFCSQVLSRFDFSTGFDSQLEAVENELDYLEPLIRNGWRDLCRGFSPGFAGFVFAQKIDCLELGQRCVQQWERPWRKLIAATDLGPGTEAAELELEQVADALTALWFESAAQIMPLLAGAKGLRSSSYSPKLLQQAYTQVERIGAGQRSFKVKDLTDLARLGTEKLAGACLKNAEPLSHPFFDSVDRFVACQKAVGEVHKLRSRGLWLELFETISEARIGFKQKLGIRSYSDLLLDLQAALSNDQEGQLAASISQQYPAALVDEFQDTDPAQYEILKRVYQHLDLPLIFVGDPKQALYGFRGADVFAYLAARGQADRIVSLSANWRAVPALIEQLNALFSFSTDPFLIPGISYKPSSAGSQAHSALTLDHKPVAALGFLLLPGNEKGARAAKPDSTRLVANSVAGEIAELISKGLAGNARIGDRDLVASDIAVLVRSHRQAQTIVQALSAQAISCTQIGATSVWSSAEAFELALVCRAINQPEAGGTVTAALGTPLVGVAASQIHLLLEDEQMMGQEISRFIGYRQLWSEAGLSASLQQLMADYSVTRQLLSQTTGERRLTNITHLMDLLQEHAFTSGCTATELLEWFSLQRSGSELQSDDALLRLESDQDLVQVMTIHKSKGLQFPVVYCPFLWDASSRFESRDKVEFHHPDGSRQAFLDLGGPDYDRHREWALDESFAEEVRVLYVALTRAIHRCVVAWGQAVGAENSPLRYLLHSEPTEPGWRSGSEVFKSMTPTEVQAVVVPLLDQAGIAWRVLAEEADQTGGIVNNQEQGAGVVAREFSGHIPRAWQVHSYSSIVAHQDFGIRDHDATSGQSRGEQPADQALTIFDVPGGPDIGSMFHEIFEELSSFAALPDEIVEMTQSKAHKYGLGPAYIQLVANQIRECLLTPLSDTDPNLSLAVIKPGERLVEMGFHLSLASCSLHDISHAAGLRPATGHLGQGFLRGYIDLIFCHEKQYFIIDYKSNHLGNELADYQPEALRLAIRASDYDLQYHLYCVAVHRFLKQRLEAYNYEQHFGGVYYLYLRGMREASGPATGVHFDRPSQSVIEHLDQLFGA